MLAMLTDFTARIFYRPPHILLSEAPGDRSLWAYTAQQFEEFLLILLRVAQMLMLFPIFSSAQIPHHVRLGLGALISFIIFHVVPPFQFDDGVFELRVAGIAQVRARRDRGVCRVARVRRRFSLRAN